ncbi:MAG: TerB family tellurite resistance protein [Pseudomonadota bacterium]
MAGKILVSRLQGDKLIVQTDEGTREYDSQFLVAALLVYVAQGDGKIDPAESAQMIDLIRDRYQLKGAESLELVTRAMNEVIAEPQLALLLTDLAPSMSDSDKEEVALMALKVIAADGRRNYNEMEHFNLAMEALHISPHIVHRAFDRYFAETMPGI